MTVRWTAAAFIRRSRVLPSLSRLMKDGIGEGYTREDHADAFEPAFCRLCQGAGRARAGFGYRRGGAVRRRTSSISLSAGRLKMSFSTQGFTENRSIDQTLDLGWRLLSLLPREELDRVDDAHVGKILQAGAGLRYFRPGRGGERAMAEQVFPTKGNLIAIKKIAGSGTDRLRSSGPQAQHPDAGDDGSDRQGGGDSVSDQHNLQGGLPRLAGARTSPSALWTMLPSPSRRRIASKITYRSVMGVEIPTVTIHPQPLKNHFGFRRTNVKLDEAYLKFDDVKRLTASLAEIENSVYRLAQGIRKPRSAPTRSRISLFRVSTSRCALSPPRWRKRSARNSPGLK